jgi:hypothetical protein
MSEQPGLARTRVGIVEWARRARAARQAELLLAAAFGRAIPTAPDGTAKAMLAGAARRHGWHAELWDGVVPELHDVGDELGPDARLEPAASVGPGDDPQAAAVGASAQLADRYRAWLGEATPVADAPVLQVLELVLRDHGGVGAS